jgi:hypothetical protein
LSTVKLMFKRCLQQGRATVVGTHAGAPAAVIFNTGLKSSGGEHTGTVFAVVAVTFVAPGPGEPFGAAEAFVTFRRQAELPESLVSSSCALPATLPSRSVALYDPGMPSRTSESFAWKLLNPQNATGLGASGCENDAVCPDGVRGVADTPNDEYWDEITEEPAARTDAPGEQAALTDDQSALIEMARRASASQPVLPNGEAMEMPQPLASEDGLGPDLVPSTVLPAGLAKNSRLMRLPKGVWDGRTAGDVVATLLRSAAESFDFATANPAAVVTLYNMEHEIPLMITPFVCRLGPSRSPKMCAAMLFGEMPSEPGVYQAFTVLPLHQAYPLARTLGPLERPAHSWLHSSPRTPWCNASDFDGKFRLEQWEQEQAAAEHAREATHRQAQPEPARASESPDTAGSDSHEATVDSSHGQALTGTADSAISGAHASETRLTIDTDGPAAIVAPATAPPSPTSELGLPEVIGVPSSFSLGASLTLEQVIRGAPIQLDPSADRSLAREAPAVAGRSGSGIHEFGTGGPFTPEKWDSRIPRGLFLPFVPFPVATEEAVTRIFSKWAPILSVSVWSATSGRRVNAAIRFASQSAKTITDTPIQKAAWDVRHHGESRYQFVDDDGTERFLWVRPLENREPRGGSTRRIGDGAESVVGSEYDSVGAAPQRHGGTGGDFGRPRAHDGQGPSRRYPPEGGHHGRGGERYRGSPPHGDGGRYGGHHPASSHRQGDHHRDHFQHHQRRGHHHAPPPHSDHGAPHMHAGATDPSGYGAYPAQMHASSFAPPGYGAGMGMPEYAHPGGMHGFPPYGMLPGMTEHHPYQHEAGDHVGMEPHAAGATHGTPPHFNPYHPHGYAQPYAPAGAYAAAHGPDGTWQAGAEAQTWHTHLPPPGGPAAPQVAAMPAAASWDASTDTFHQEAYQGVPSSAPEPGYAGFR